MLNARCEDAGLRGAVPSWSGRVGSKLALTGERSSPHPPPPTRDGPHVFLPASLHVADSPSVTGGLPLPTSLAKY